MYALIFHIKVISMKKEIYAIVAIVVVIIVVIAAFAIINYKPTISVSPPTSVTVSASTQFALEGSSITFSATVTGNATNIVWNFGDGTTGNGKVVNHTYQQPGSYLVEVNASNSAGYVTNLANLFPITVTPETVSPLIASEITIPILSFNYSANKNAPIFSINESVELDGSYLQPPTASNWTLAYYIFNFGDGSNSTYPVNFNITSGTYQSIKVMHSYRNSGFYYLNFTIITCNETPFQNDLITQNGLTYLPLNYENSVLKGEHHLITYFVTIYVSFPGQTAGILKGPSNIPNPYMIKVAELYHSPYSLDPAISFDFPGMEILANIYETLIAYNGSSTFSFIPVVAKQIPTIANGLVSPDGLNYTFQIREGLKFSNGDNLTVWDVYTSLVRDLLFMLGSPSTPGWILGQDLLPGGGFLPGAVSYQNITKAITYNNATQTITFHLLKPDSAFLDYLADPEGSSIMDYKWLVKHNAGITFTPAGFQQYMNYSMEQNYNTYIQYNAMGSGAFEISSYLFSQYIILQPNLNFTPIPNIPGYNHIPNFSVYIEYVKDPSTMVLMMQNSMADIYSYLPTYDYPIASQLQSKGLLQIYTFPTFTINFFCFNWDVNVTLMQSTFGSQYYVPEHYFANEYVRKAFTYAFNYTNFIENVLGNKKYNANFGFNYTGIIPKGMIGYLPPDKLSNVPVYNLTLAKQYMLESGLYNVSVNIPIAMYAGDSVDYAAASMWLQNLSQIDPNIHGVPIYQPGSTMLGYMVPGGNPMPLYILSGGSWAPDYPYPSDYENAMYLEGGFYTAANGMNSTNLISAGYYQEAGEWENMTELILKADSSINSTLAIEYFDQAEQIAVNLSLYLYTYQQNGMWIFAPWISGMSYEENPMFGGSDAILYFYLTKG